MSIGGAFDKKNSKPVTVTGIRAADLRWPLDCSRTRLQHRHHDFAWAAAVVIEVGQVQILVAERSAMTVDPELFRSHGIDPVYCKIVVVKSPERIPRRV